MMTTLATATVEVVDNDPTNFRFKINVPAGLPGGEGQRGSNWLTGAGAPSVATSDQAGDLYLDTNTQDVYRFDGSGWGSPITNIKGAPGTGTGDSSDKLPLAGGTLTGDLNVTPTGQDRSFNVGTDTHFTQGSDIIPSRRHF